MRILKSFAVAAIVLTSMTSCRVQQTVINEPAKPVAAEKQRVNLILDADFGSSTDDLFVLMMIHHYIDDGLVDLKGIIVDREGDKNAGLVDIFDNYYGHPDIPIGLERNGVKNPRCFIPYYGICDLKDAQGRPLYKRSQDVATMPDGYKLYRRLLSQADDNSLVVVAIGFATTLSQLFESGADEFSPMSGVELFGKKVKAVYVQSGRFEAGDSLCGYNMRAASRQSAIFYERLPKNVDLIMSPSNVGDAMNYTPQDVLADLSYTELDPIKTVYANYTCDPGQRMWDVNCLVNAVMGDGEYSLSQRGWVTFVDRGEESLMLFSPHPQGNARYQLPGDSYFAQEKLMDIRRHTRMTRHPSRYTIESPQPQLTGVAAAEWARPRLPMLVDKYVGSAGNKLDPNDVRMLLFRPLGYVGPNDEDYAEAERLVVDAIYDRMLRKAQQYGKKDVVIVTGAPASGKSTAVQQMNLKKAGLIYDAALTEPGRLVAAISRAKELGMEKVTVVMVYNDLMTCFKNAMNRGRTQWRYTSVDDMVKAFRSNTGQIDNVSQAFPDVEIVPVDMSGNSGLNRVTLEQAKAWKHDVSDADMTQLFEYVLEEINSGEVDPMLVPSVVGNIEQIPGLSAANAALATKIARRANEITESLKH